MTTIDHDDATLDADEATAESADEAGSRRNLLKLAAGAAAGGAVVALAGSKPAAAGDNDPIRIAETTTQGNLGRSSTIVNYVNANGPQVTPIVGPPVNANIMTIRDSPTAATLFDLSSSSFPAALGGYAYERVPHGMYGYAASDNPGYGVVALGVGSGNAGLFARGVKANIELHNAGDAPAARVDAHVAGEMIADSGGNLWYCVTGGTPGTWRKVSGGDTSGAFHAVTPYRGYDSRRPAPEPGIIAGGGTTRDVSIKDSRSPSDGSIIATDVVPEGATAVAFTITVVNTVAAGNLTVTEGGAGSTTASTINWYESNAIVANSSVVKLDSNRQVRVFNNTTNPGATTNFLIDITGYYL